MITGDEAVDTETFRIQVEGREKTGKSWFALSVVDHFLNVMKLEPEQIQVSILDWDMGGVVPHIRRLDKAVQKRISYWKAEDILDGYDGWDALSGIMRDHLNDTGVAPVFINENNGRMWQASQDYYSEAVLGKSMREALVEAAKTAKMKGNRTSPVFGDPMSAYGVINPLHNELRDKMVNGDFNLIWTTHLKDVYGNKKAGTANEVVDVRGDGQKNNQDFIDHIIRREIIKDTRVSHILHSREINTYKKNIRDMDFTKFWTTIYEVAEEEGNMSLSERYWMKEMSVTKPTPKPKAEKVEAAVEEEDTEDDGW